MKKIPFSHPFNYDWTKHLEECDPVSLTIPDESKTVRQLLEDYSKGKHLGISSRDGLYDDDADFDDYNYLEDGNTDLVDIMEAASSAHYVVEKARNAKERALAIQREQQLLSRLKDSLNDSEAVTKE